MIISRQLEEGMTLVRKDENLTIKTLVRTGRSCTAVVLNKKGKEEKLTITDMWNQKVRILNPEKKIPEAVAKKPLLKPVVKTKTVTEAKKEKPAKKAGSSLIVTEVKRANGVATIYHKKDGSLFCSSWKRTV